MYSLFLDDELESQRLLRRSVLEVYSAVAYIYSMIDKVIKVIKSIVEYFLNQIIDY